MWLAAESNPNSNSLRPPNLQEARPEPRLVRPYPNFDLTVPDFALPCPPWNSAVRQLCCQRPVTLRVSNCCGVRKFLPQLELQEQSTLPTSCTSHDDLLSEEEAWEWA